MLNDLKCQWCNKSCNGLRGLSSHERRCPSNGDLIRLKNSKNKDDSLFVLSRENLSLEWKELFKHLIINYNLSYNEVSYSSLEAQSLALKDGIGIYSKEILSFCQYLMNDIGWDSKECIIGLGVYQQTKENCSNPWLKRAKFYLTEIEYLSKIVEANILPSQIGKNGGSCYQLSRKEDLGEYTIDNCYFELQTINAVPKQPVDYSSRDLSYLSSPEALKIRSEAGLKGWETRRKNYG